jgi:translation initiation factor IF-3
VNEQIRVREVRLVGDNIPNPGIFTREEALRLADQLELDLVEVSPSAEPPVCKIIDFNKFVYDQKKKQKEIKANATKMVVKEIRFGPNTDDHDFEFKVKHAEKFLQEGAKVKAYVFFKGRTIMFKEKGEEILRKFTDELQDWGKLEHPPTLDGKRMIIHLTPSKKK